MERVENSSTHAKLEGIGRNVDMGKAMRARAREGRERRKARPIRQVAWRRRRPHSRHRAVGTRPLPRSLRGWRFECHADDCCVPLGPREHVQLTCLHESARRTRQARVYRDALRRHPDVRDAVMPRDLQRRQFRKPPPAHMHGMS